MAISTLLGLFALFESGAVSCDCVFVQFRIYEEARFNALTGNVAVIHNIAGLPLSSTVVVHASQDLFIPEMKLREGGSGSRSDASGCNVKCNVKCNVSAGDCHLVDVDFTNIEASNRLGDVRGVVVGTGAAEHDERRRAPATAMRSKWLQGSGKDFTAKAEE